MHPQSTQPEKKKPGCFKSLIALVLLVAIIAAVVSMIGGDANTFAVESEVLIMQDANFTVSGDTCTGAGTFAGVTGGATVTITADNGDQVTAQLGDGVLSPEGNCLLAFTVELPESDRYGIDVGGQSQIKSANSIGTNDDGSRWMSVQYD